MRVVAMIVALLTATLAMSATYEPAEAQSQVFTFNIRSSHPNIVELRFYSQDRNVSWPGPNRVYSLDDSQVHSVPLRCLGGEKICYGAWVQGNTNTYWGLGPSGKARCEKCCYTCTPDSSQVINLTTR
jgi:hypothetical protein